MTPTQIHDFVLSCFLSFYLGGVTVHLMIQRYIGNKLPWDLRVILAIVWPLTLFGKNSEVDEEEM